MRSMMRPLASAVLPFAFAACSTTSSTPPSAVASSSTGDDVPAAIAVPASSHLALTLKGSGLQNYECRAKAGSANDFEWVFVSPEAVLKDERNNLVGRHYGGPTWEHADGSKVTGSVVATVPAPVSGSIPWLLLKKSTSDGTGTLRDVTYVQRTHTSGGVSPADVCSAPAIGTRKAVRYTADYLFYKS